MYGSDNQPRKTGPQVDMSQLAEQIEQRRASNSGLGNASPSGSKFFMGNSFRNSKLPANPSVNAMLAG